VFSCAFLTLLFANFAEAIAEARGKAQADSLRKTREETPAKKRFHAMGKILMKYKLFIFPTKKR
jgi:K+-transporting ATPase ATPase B chain